MLIRTIFIMLLSGVFGFANATVDIEVVKSETHAKNVLNMPYTGGFKPSFYQTYVGDINFDGLADYRIQFSSKLGESPFLHDSQEIKDKKTLMSEQLHSNNDPISELLEARTLSVQSELIIRKSDGTENAERTNSYTYKSLYIYSQANGTYVIDSLFENDLDPCRNNLCFLESSLYWSAIPAQILWKDIDGDKRNDIFFRPINLNHSRGLPPAFINMPSLVILAGAFKYNGNYPLGYAKTLPRISQVITDAMFGEHLYNMGSASLTDMNSDGRADLSIKRSNSSPTEVLYAISLPGGIFEARSWIAPDDKPMKEAYCQIPVSIPGSAHGQYFTDGNCTRVYTLPPSVGETDVFDVSTHNNLAMCTQINNLINENNRTLEDIAALNNDLMQLILDLATGPEYQQFKAAHDQAYQDLMFNRLPKKEQAERALQNAETLLEEAKFLLELGIGTQAEVNAEQAKVNVAKVELEYATYEYLLAVEWEAQTESALLQFVEQNAAQQQAITSMIQSLIQINQQRSEMVAEMNQLEGGTVRFALVSNWSQQVLDYIKQNPLLKSKAQFEKMPLTSARLVSGINENAASLNGILWTRMLDIRNQPGTTSDSRYGPAIPQNAEANPLAAFFDEEFTEPGKDNYHAEAAFNLQALCPHYPRGATDAMPSTLQNLPKLFSFHLKQNYQLKIASGYRTVFNLGVLSKHMFNYVLQHGDPSRYYLSAFIRHHLTEKGPGFFFSHLYSVDRNALMAYIHQLSDQDWFGIRFMENKYSLAEQEEIRTQLKQRLIESVLSAISVERRYKPMECVPSVVGCSIPHYVLINIWQLQRFIGYHSNWQFSDNSEYHFEDGAVYTDYR